MTTTKRFVGHEGNIWSRNAGCVRKHVLDGEAMLGIGSIIVHGEKKMIVIDAQRQVLLENSELEEKDMEAKETEDAGFRWMADSSN